MIVSHLHSGGHAPGSVDVLGWLPVVALVLLAGSAYLLMVARRRRIMRRSWSRWRTASWLLGVLLVGVAVSPPLAGFGHADARGHMVQHLLMGMYAPLALVLAAPVTVLLGAFSGPTRRGIGAVLGSLPVHVVSHPAAAGLINVGGLYVLYLSGLYAASIQSPVLHALVKVHFVLAGALFAWAIAGPDPAPRRPGMAPRVAALLLTAAAHAFLAKVLYAQAAMLPPRTAYDVAEMQQAAQWMYYGGDVAELLLATALFATWYQARGRMRVAGSRATSPPTRPGPSTAAT